MTVEAAILRAVAATGSARPVVLIDGGAGAGKTTLAASLAEAWPGRVQLVGMDALYPGWGGLAAGSATVAGSVLRPDDPGYRRWDWAASRPAEWVALDPSLPLLVEGCGALTPRTRARADLGVWCELEEAERRRRAIARDGELFASHWEEWEAQEAEHWRAHRPWELADITVSPVSLA
ncbi:MAG: cobalt ABC transporter [Propionicimonas sp.]|nr:cobalt ABC transporter [Propionicimonas sp.]